MRGLRFGALVVWVSVFLSTSPFVLADTSVSDDEKIAIEAVASFLREMGDKDAADTWTAGWKSGIYTLKSLGAAIEAEAGPGSPRIAFKDQMVEQISRRGQVDQAKVADWAATFKHELVHTRQGKIGWSASWWSHVLGGDHPYEAKAWGEGFGSYWKWMRIAHRNYRMASSESDRLKFARQVLELAESFKTYHTNFVNEKFGALPARLTFLPLAGTDATPLTFDEALQETEKLIASLSSTMRLTVKLNRTEYKLKAGETMTLRADAQNYWGRQPAFSWKADNTELKGETAGYLSRVATVSETITVTVTDHRSQKASASCRVIVEDPAGGAPPAKVVSPGTRSATATTPKPPTPEFAWVPTGSRMNDWTRRLDAQNAASPAWRLDVSASDGSVTIKNTYVGNRTDLWVRNGMAQSGTATWTPPPMTTIRPDDDISLDLTVINAPRDHSNFPGIISVSVRVWRLNDDGTRSGNPISYFADAKGTEVFGYYGRQEAPKTPVRATVSGRLPAGRKEGQRVIICVVAQGASQSVESEYIYTWKRL